MSEQEFTPDPPKLEKSLSFRLTKEELRKLRELAKKANANPGSIIRQLVNNASV